MVALVNHQPLSFSDFFWSGLKPRQWGAKAPIFLRIIPDDFLADRDPHTGVRARQKSSVVQAFPRPLHTRNKKLLGGLEKASFMLVFEIRSDLKVLGGGGA